jgi:hypothetical protein
MSRRAGARGVAAGLGAAAWLAACGGGPGGPLPDATAGVELVRSGAVVDFHARATEFYARLEGRRFNSIATFRDAGLREYFRDERTFSDYYADLAQQLADAHLERSRPVGTAVEEFLVDAPGRARVRVRIRGDHGLPLRWWATEVVREDRWERADGRWWILPGSL